MEVKRPFVAYSESQRRYERRWFMLVLAMIVAAGAAGFIVPAAYLQIASIGAIIAAATIVVVAPVSANPTIELLPFIPIAFMAGVLLANLPAGSLDVVYDYVRESINRQY